MGGTMDTFPSVATFLRDAKQSLLLQQQQQLQQQQSPPPHLVLGNPAGDADSIISAIGLAYIDSILMQQRTGGNGNANDNKIDNNSRHSLPSIPVISIPIPDLKTQRPETTYLLKECAGLTDADLDEMIGIDQRQRRRSNNSDNNSNNNNIPPLLPNDATVTLVDHNHHHHHLLDGDSNNTWTVTEIIDHHVDEGHHHDTTAIHQRNIAFEGAEPLVASTCTLIVERFYEISHKNNNSTAELGGRVAVAVSWPPTLAILLLGVILLDSVNMLPGKGMPRDGTAIDKLLRDTDWTQLALPDEIVNTHSDNGSSSSSSKQKKEPDPTKLFQCLQAQKFSPTFWNGLTALQGIRMDYKSFPLLPTETNEFLGIATILQDRETFWSKEDVVESMAQVIRADNLQVLGFMHTFMKADGGGERKQPFRQLVLGSFNKELLVRLLQYLTNDTEKLDVDLQLTGYDKVLEYQLSSSDNHTSTLFVVKMDQGNAKASRKQVAPVLTSFWKYTTLDRTEL